MMPYSKHTNMELLSECRNCIGDAIRYDLEHGIRRPKAIVLLMELRKRTEEELVVSCRFCGSRRQWKAMLRFLENCQDGRSHGE